jgi:hypothetical protein
MDSKTGGEWLSSISDLLNPWRKNLLWPFIRMIDGLQNQLDAVEKTNFLAAVGNQTPIPRLLNP